MGSDAKRQRAPLACVVLAPDLPKGVLNGYTERIAKRIGGILRRSGRSADAIGRVEQLEFVVLAAATGVEGAEKLAQRFDALLRSSGEADDASKGFGPLRFRTALSAVPDFTQEDADPVELIAKTRAALTEARPAA